MSKTRRPEFWLSTVAGSANHYITWYDRSVTPKRTCRKSTGTADQGLAEIALAKHVIENATLSSAPRTRAQIATLLHQWNVEHGSQVASRKTNGYAVAALLEEFGAETLDVLTPDRQDIMVANLRGHGWKDSTVNRTITVLRASIMWAWRKGRIESYPFIEAVEENEPKPKHIFTPEEFAEFLERTCEIEHLFRFTMIMANTLARPGAAQELTSFQVFGQHGYIDLNPAGRQQNKKHRPKVPITKTLRPWLPLWTGSGPYVQWGGDGMADVQCFERLGREMKLPVTPYCVRHTMATELAKRGVPQEQRDRFMGHQRAGSKTGERYVHFEPTWLKEAKDAIDDYMAALPVRFALRPAKKVGFIRAVS